MRAVAEGRVDQIIVYKIDRLTRSLTDFAKLVEQLDQAGTSFVSVTQSFNTATSMGRLTLNMLLSFAQFEREVTAERIRDKIAASKRKGLWMGGQVPFGYDPDGRTLAINKSEASVVKHLYDLYQQHQNLREVTDQAKKLELRTRTRPRSNGRISGGLPFSRGHIHHILTNPIYAGRIRHKSEVYDGKHPAIIDPSRFDKVRGLLTTNSNKTRGKATYGLRSPLVGKLFDETGDNLTPSHTQKYGRRLRYYISKRLTTGRREDHPDTWRLPAEALEHQLAQVVAQKLSDPTAATNLTRDLSAGQFLKIETRLQVPTARQKTLSLIERVDLAQGAIKIRLCGKKIADHLGLCSSEINSLVLTFDAPFQMRRRGVELKLCFGDAPPEIDKTLVKNIVRARHYLAQIFDGNSLAQIAKAETTSSSRIKNLLELALLAPNIIDEIAIGQQPVGLTSDYLIKSNLSPNWAKQLDQIAKLRA